MSVLYLFQETTIGGEACSKPQFFTLPELRSFLFLDCKLPRETINFAIAVTQQNPNVPYDLCRDDGEGKAVWTARITFLKVETKH